MNYRIKRLIILGIISITGVFGIQFYLLSKSYSVEQRMFHQKVHVALMEVVKRIHNIEESMTPAINPIESFTNNYWIVNLERDIDCETLEFLLKSEFEKAGILTDFEYGIYDCQTDEMVYGSYISYNDKYPDYNPSILPKHEDLIYYFGVRFPKQHWFIAAGMWMWTIFTLISFTVLIFFVYAIIVVLKQKRFSELQRDVMNNMTHQFKTPLAANKLALDYLHENETIQSNTRILKYCETLKEQNERLNKYVDTILTVSQTERRTIEITKTEFTITSVIDDEIALFKIKEPNAKFTFNGVNKELKISADLFQFTNLVHNLLDNALKYSNSQPSVKIEINELGKHIELIIKDNGIGIPANQVKKIFKRFYRISTGDVHNVKGFGLGLYYVKQVCDLHKWKIKVESKLNIGTSIHITIPLLK